MKNPAQIFLKAEEETPMMQQYVSIKKEYPDSILFFRMGDFYEMFNEDAEIASRVLEITLTSRNKKRPTPFPCAVFHTTPLNLILRN